MKKRKVFGFTLVEMVVTLMIIITLSLLSFPLYKGRTNEQSKLAEGYALLGTIVSAQVAYYNEYGYFYAGEKASNGWYGYVSTNNDPVLGINSVNNRYFEKFMYVADGFGSQGKIKEHITGIVYGGEAGTIALEYNVTKRFEPVVSGI